MKKEPTYHLFVPPEIKDLIDLNVKGNRINYYFLIHYLFVRTLICKNSDNDFIAISSDYFKSITGYKSTNYVNLLRKCEIIIDDDSYQSDVKSLHYKINPSIKITPGFVEISRSDKIFHKIKKDAFRSRAHVNELPPHLNAMFKLFFSLELSYDEAFNSIIENNEFDLYKKTSYFFSIEMFRNRDYRYFKRNRTNNRLDTNLTNLPKALRQFIKVENLYAIDLKNSQPFLLSILFILIFNRNNKQTIPLCLFLAESKILKSFGVYALQRIDKFHENDKNSFFVEFSKFCEWTRNGVFYDNFVNDYDGEITRDQVKSDVLRLLFSRNRIIKNYRSFIPFEAEKKRFSKVFPILYDCIKELKEKDHRNLSNALTKIESYIFIDVICKKLHENGITPLTIHDSVLVKEADVQKTHQIMQDTFLELTGFIPTFGIEKVT